MIYSVVLASGVQQSESIIHIHISTLIFIFFSHIGHYRVLSGVPCAIQQVLINYLFLPPGYNFFSCLRKSNHQALADHA